MRVKFTRKSFQLVAKTQHLKNYLCLAANLDWNLRQLNIKNAFLNGDLEEEVYMNDPLGCT